MMDRIREGAHKSIAIKIILGVIILSFLLASISSYLFSIFGGANAAAKVGDTEISRNQLEQAYQNQRNRMQQQYGDYFSTLLANADYVKSFRRSILDNLINDVLLEQYAESLNLKVSDAQIETMILGMSEFQVGGKFDLKTYQAALRRIGYKPEYFAHLLRQDALRNQISTALEGSEFVLKGEVQTLGQLVSQTRTIRSIPLSLTQFVEKIKPTDGEIQSYYQDHSSAFIRPEQMKVAYLELSAEKLRADIKVTDEEALQYYQENIDKYVTQSQRKVSHILVKGDDKAKAQALLDELNSGADFAKLATEKSEDSGSAEEGGSLGWIEHGVMDPALEEAAFALSNVGDISGLVKSNFGWHIVRLDEIKAQQTKPYAEVAAEITQELTDNRAVEQFYSLQKQLEKIAFEYPDTLEEAAAAIKQPIQATDFVSLQNVPESLRNTAIQEALNTPEVRTDGLNSSVIEVAPEHVVVVRVQESRPSLVLPLDEVKGDVIAKFAKDKAQQQMSTLAKTLVDGLKAGDQSVLAANNVAFGDEQVIDRNTPLAKTVFAMPKPMQDKLSYIQTNDSNGDIVIIELSKVENTLNPNYVAQVEQQLQQSGVTLDLQVVLADLREKADIVYYSAE